jgi:hypothetical protein
MDANPLPGKRYMRYVVLGLGVALILNLAHLGIRFLREYKSHAAPDTTYAVTVTVEPLRWLVYVVVEGVLLAVVLYGFRYVIGWIRGR